MKGQTPPTLPGHYIPPPRLYDLTNTNTPPSRLVVKSSSLRNTPKPACFLDRYQDLASPSSRPSYGGGGPGIGWMGFGTGSPLAITTGGIGPFGPGEGFGFGFGGAIIESWVGWVDVRRVVEQADVECGRVYSSIIIADDGVFGWYFYKLLLSTERMGKAATVKGGTQRRYMRLREVAKATLAITVVFGSNHLIYDVENKVGITHVACRRLPQLSGSDMQLHREVECVGADFLLDDIR